MRSKVNGLEIFQQKVGPQAVVQHDSSNICRVSAIKKIRSASRLVVTDRILHREHG